VKYLLSLRFYFPFIMSVIFFFTFCRGCLIVRQSFFHNNPDKFVDLGGGVMGCPGFHSSFRGSQSGLSLNMGMH
jgi:hypothetical protein